MPDIEVTSVDLAQGLKVKNIEVPSMVIDVVLKNPPSDLQKALKDDKVILQKIVMAAVDVLSDAKKAFQEGASKLDASYAKDPPSDMKEAEDRVKTFNNTCKQICDAQGKAAVQAAEAQWTAQTRKNKALAKYDGLFAMRVVLGVVSVAASVAHTIMTFGASSAVAILSIAKTCASMVTDIYNHCRDMEKAETDIINTDAALAKDWTDSKKTSGKVGKELAAALGVPFVKSIGGLEKLLTEYDGKNAKKDKLADQLYTKAKALMKSIKDAGEDAPADVQKKLKTMGTKADDLLDQIGKLSAAGKSNELFSETYRARLKVYQEMEGAKLGKTAAVTGIAVIAGGAAATADTIVEIAKALA